MSRGLLILLLFAAASPQAAEVYRWLDATGRVHYSDQPPPPSAKQALKVKSKANVVDVDKESYETRLAREKNPVILYVTACGPVCDEAREHLTRRGVPFTAKDPSKDPEFAVELKKLIGVLEVPVIQIGTTHQKGFEAGSWDSMLDAAGYPKSPLIPTPQPAPKQP